MRNITVRRIAITTFGSLGDLHPYLAIGQELARRGHHVVVITLPMFRERVEAAGLSFAPLHGATTETPSPELMRRVLLRPDGVKYIIRELLMPVIRRAYADTLAAADGAEILVSHPLTLATSLVAEATGTPWVSTQLAPLSFSSAYDPPVLPGLGVIAGWHLPPASIALCSIWPNDRRADGCNHGTHFGRNSGA